MPKWICSLLAVLLAAPLAHAGRISREQAIQVAAEWLQGQGRAQAKSFSAPQLREIPVSDIQARLLAYGQDGFILVGGTKENPAVMGYGKTDGGELPANLHHILTQADVSSELANQRAFLQSENEFPAAKSVKIAPVAPFITTFRHQEAPFNARCPFYRNADGTLSQERCLVGCVATALEQVLTYYKYPQALQDTLKGWTTDHYAVDTILPGQTIDYESILDSYSGAYTEAQSKAVSDLCYYCGIAAHMNWGIDASGASCLNLVKPMKQVFGYQYVRHLYPSDYTLSRWQELLYEELKNKRPVYFAGYTSRLQGHALLLDGIDEGGFYHVVWGYGGNYDGFFDLQVLNMFESPSTPTAIGQLMGHFCNQEALFLAPWEVAFTDSDTLVHKHRIVVDSVRFLRPIDTGRYMTARLWAHNASADTLTASFLLSTFSLQDSIWEEAAGMENIGLAGRIMGPQEHVCLTAYCQFRQTGDRVLTISTDDSAFCYLDTVHVVYTSAVPLSVMTKDSLIQPQEIHFTFYVQNPSAKDWAGNLLTYCLFEGDYDESTADVRHWSVLNMPPSSETTDTVSFYHLKPSTRYTLLVRNQWPITYTTTFTTPSPAGILQLRDEQPLLYRDLNGNPIRNPRPGIYLMRKDGVWRKIFIP